MGAAITGCTSEQIAPASGKKIIFVKTPSTADSADTLDVTSAAATGGETLSTIDFLICWDQNTGDIVTATESSGDITIDTGGSTTDHVYALLIVGDA